MVDRKKICELHLIQSAEAVEYTDCISAEFFKEIQVDTTQIRESIKSKSAHWTINQPKIIVKLGNYSKTKTNLAQSTGAVEYTECISAEG